MTLTKYPRILFLDLDGCMITRDDDGDLEEFFREQIKPYEERLINHNNKKRNNKK